MGLSLCIIVVVDVTLYSRHTVGAVPRGEPETVNNYIAWDPETVNRKGLQVTKKLRSFTCP
jgi:hypothetical protein